VLSQVLLGFDRIPLTSVAQYSPADGNKQCPLFWNSLAPSYYPRNGPDFQVGRWKALNE
jgi:hypothetical protein